MVKYSEDVFFYNYNNNIIDLAIIIKVCRYTAILHGYECDIAFIQQFDGTSG